MHTGDLEPDWVVDVADADGVADLGTVASWRFVGWRQTGNGRVTVFTDTDPGTVPSGSTAVVTHEWADGETDVAGVMHADIVAVWPGGREQTFTGATINIKPSTD